MTRSNDDMCAELESMTLRELRELYAAVFGETPRSPNKRFLARRIVEARTRSGALDVDERRVSPDVEPFVDHTTPATPRLTGPGDGALGAGLRSRASREPIAISEDDEEVLEGAAEQDTEDEDHVEGSASASGAGDECPPATAASEGAESTPTVLVGTLVRRRGQFNGMTVRRLQAMHLQVVGRKTGSLDPEYLKWKFLETQNGNLPSGPRLRAGRPATPRRTARRREHVPRQRAPGNAQ